VDSPTAQRHVEPRIRFIFPVKEVVNAVSVASVLLLTEATMTEIPSDKKNAAAALES
jgi:hypothetical protein